jgi:hypothetical protein
MKKLRWLLILMAVILASVPILVSAATTATVTITATPTYIALTNDTGNWAIGVVVETTTYYFTADDLVPAEPLVDGDMKGTITNTGSVAEDIDVKCADFTGGVGWSISADDSPAADEVSIRTGITGMENRAAMIQTINTDTELKDNLAAAGTIKWCAELETGTFGDGVAKEGILTLTASAAN